MTVFYDRSGRRVHPPGPLSERRQARTGHRRYALDALSRCPSCASTRSAGTGRSSPGERSRRPGGEPTLRARRSRSTPRGTRSPRATRTARRRSSTRCGPAAAPRTRPAGRVRVVPNLYPALDPAPERGRRARARRTRGRGAQPELFISLPATGAHEVIVNGPQPVLSLAELPVEQVLAAVEAWRERMRAHERQRLPAADRQRAPRGRRLAAAHPRAAVRAGLRARRRWPASASARAPTRPGRWARACSATWSPRRSAGASGSWRSTRRRC